MSIQTELARLTNAKAAIQAAIEGKGVTVPSGTLLDGMAALIEGIEAGGSGEYDFSSFIFPITKSVSGTFILDSNQTSYTIKHNLGITPKIIMIFADNPATIIGQSVRASCGGIMLMNRLYIDAFPTEVIDDPLYMVTMNISMSSSSAAYYSIYGQHYFNDGQNISQTGTKAYNPYNSSSGSYASFKLVSTYSKIEEKSKSEITFCPYAGSAQAAIKGGELYHYFAAA